MASTSQAALRDALDQITAGRVGELLLAVIALISVGLAALVDPIAGALFAGGMFVLLVALAVYVLHQRAIALEAPRKRGERAKLVSRRMVQGAFTEETEWVEYDLKQKSRSSGIEVRFPTGRAPQKVRLRRREDGATEDVTDMLEDSGNRKVFRAEIGRPAKGARLKLSWDWQV